VYGWSIKESSLLVDVSGCPCLVAAEAIAAHLSMFGWVLHYSQGSTRTFPVAGDEIFHFTIQLPPPCGSSSAFHPSDGQLLVPLEIIFVHLDIHC
jgi:hypothetical protein